MEKEKKAINVLIAFFIYHKSDIKTFLKWILNQCHTALINMTLVYYHLAKWKLLNYCLLSPCKQFCKVRLVTRDVSSFFIFYFLFFLMCSKGWFHLESQALNPFLSSFFFWWQIMKASTSKINTTRRLSWEINNWTIMHPSNKTNTTGGQSCKTSKLPKTWENNRWTIIYTSNKTNTTGGQHASMK